MLSSEEEDATVCEVVVNHEEQYSLWPKHKTIPAGGRAIGKDGPKPENLKCLQKHGLI
jgi:MbtH protein